MISISYRLFSTVTFRSIIFFYHLFCHFSCHFFLFFFLPSLCDDLYKAAADESVAVGQSTNQPGNQPTNRSTSVAHDFWPNKKRPLCFTSQRSYPAHDRCNTVGNSRCSVAAGSSARATRNLQQARGGSGSVRGHGIGRRSVVEGVSGGDWGREQLSVSPWRLHRRRKTRTARELSAVVGDSSGDKG